MVGRTGPIGSSFVSRDVDGRDVLFCGICVSLFIAVAVGEATGLGVAVVSECDSPVLFGFGTDRSLRPSPASAPDARICSSVGATDFFSRDLRLVGTGVADSKGVASDSEDGVVCVGASGFVSRGTTTSCAWICPTNTRLQSNDRKNLSILAELSQLGARLESPATESEGAIRSPDKFPRDASRIAETAPRRNNARSLRGPPSPSTQTRPPPAR